MRSSSSRALPRAKHHATKQVLSDLKSTQSIAGLKQIHAHIFTSGLSSSRLTSNLSRSYALAGHVRYARKLFDELPHRSSPLISAVMRMYVQKKFPGEALTVFSAMVNDGKSKPDDYTFPFSLKASGELRHPGAGAAVHCRALTAGCSSDSFVRNSLLSMYMNFNDVKSAQKVFDEMPHKGVVSWNAMIHGCFRNGMAEESMRLFSTMTAAPDGATAVAALPACGATGNLSAGREIHSLVINNSGTKPDVRVYNALIDMYGRCGEAAEAWAVFEKIPEGERDVVAWTSVMNALVMNGEESAAVELSGAMESSGVRPNSATLSLLLSACASPELLRSGRRLHGLALRLNLAGEAFVATALVDMYAKCGFAGLSFRAFEAAGPRPAAAVWGAAISGCSRSEVAVEIFRRMLREGAGPPTPATVVGLDYGAQADPAHFHTYLAKSGLVSSVEVATGLMDAYSKSGRWEAGRRVFSEIPEERRDVFAYSAMIACLGRHGEGPAAVRLFERMAGPSEVALTSALHACSHCGMVEEGLRLFSGAVAAGKPRLSPGHFSCLVDLLGRAHRLADALCLARALPAGPTAAVVWGALLGACATHDDVAVGEAAAGRLFELEPQNTGNYVLMASIYAKAGRWEDAERMHRVMDEIGIRKSPAHSLLQLTTT